MVNTEITMPQSPLSIVAESLGEGIISPLWHQRYFFSYVRQKFIEIIGEKKRNRLSLIYFLYCFNFQQSFDTNNWAYTDQQNTTFNSSSVSMEKKKKKTCTALEKMFSIYFLHTILEFILITSRIELNYHLRRAGNVTVFERQKHVDGTKHNLKLSKVLNLKECKEPTTPQI